jgi:hypothetical protein
MKEAILAIVTGVLNLVTLALKMFLPDPTVAQFFDLATPILTTICAALLAIFGVQNAKALSIVQRKK